MVFAAASDRDFIGAIVIDTVVTQDPGSRIQDPPYRHWSILSPNGSWHSWRQVLLSSQYPINNQVIKEDRMSKATYVPLVWQTLLANNEYWKFYWICHLWLFERDPLSKPQGSLVRLSVRPFVRLSVYPSVGTSELKKVKKIR